MANASDAVRYGVFLRPSPELIDEAIRAMLIVRHQYGLTAAVAYPPHITLVGSIALDPERPMARSDTQCSRVTAREHELITAIGSALSSHAPQRLRLRDLHLSGANYVMYRLTDAPNNDVSALMGDILRAVQPVRVFHDTDRTAAQRRRDAPASFAPHLTVLGHDGADQPEIAAEAHGVLTDLGFGTPRDLELDTVSLLRIGSTNWAGEYWRDMDYRILKSWKL